MVDRIFRNYTIFARNQGLEYRNGKLKSSFNNSKHTSSYRCWRKWYNVRI